MYLRQLFPTAEAAQSALEKALSGMNASLIAQAKEAGYELGTPIPTVSITAISVRDLTVSTNDMTGELPRNASQMAVATVRASTAFNPLGEETQLTTLATEKATETPSSGIVRVYAAPGYLFQARFKATVAAKIRAFFSSVITLAANSELQDPASKKMYKTSGSFTPGAAGYATINVVESDSADHGEVTRGTQLRWVEPPNGLAETASVIGLKAATVTLGSVLTDDSGRHYLTGSGTSTSTNTALYGDVTDDVEFVAASTGDNVALGTKLTLSTHINGISDEAEVVAVPTPAIPSDAIFNFIGTDGNTYQASIAETAKVSDLGYAEVEALALKTLKAATMTPGGTYSFPSPPAGFSSIVECVSSSPPSFFPKQQAKRLFGGALALVGRVQQTLDGRYAAVIYTSPASS